MEPIYIIIMVKYMRAFFIIALLGTALFASGSLEGSQTAIQRINNDELQKLIADPEFQLLLVDVRSPSEYASGYIPGAILFPHSELDSRKEDFRKLAERIDRPIAVYCRSGARSSTAAAILKKQGYTKVYDFGGIGNWRGDLSYSDIDA